MIWGETAQLKALNVKRVDPHIAGMLIVVFRTPFAVVALSEKETKQKEMVIIPLTNRCKWSFAVEEATGLNGENMNYKEWEEWFLRANKHTYEAEMKVCDFEDRGDTSSDAYWSWKKEAREWRENQDQAISEHPKFHARYLKHRGKPSQSKASAEANGGKHSSGSNWFIWVIVIAGVLWFLSK